MSTERFMIVKVSKRRETADAVQKALTEFGCIIQMRLGLHEATGVCSDEGLIILQLASDPEEAKKLETALGGIAGVTFKAVEV